MATEVWFRNPDNYVRELVEVGYSNIVWDRGMLVKRSIDPVAHAGLYFGRAHPWRLLVVGEQGTMELDAEHDSSNPIGVYPTWCYGEEAELLEEIVEQPIGQSKELCFDMTVPSDERPVWNQPHRVVVMDLPNVASGPGRKFIRFLKTLQEDHPECIIHVHGLYSYRMAFGMGFAAADTEPRTIASKGKVTTPSGREVTYERAQANSNWVTPMGFKPADLSVPRNRCMYNIKTALWAGKNFVEIEKFKIKGHSAIDVSSSDADHKPATTSSIFIGKVGKKSEGDQFHCDTCSLQDKCKYQRDGAVCSVPGAEPTELAKYFKTRDSGMIIDGLGTLMAAQTKRLERGLEEENDFGELDPEVTKIMNQLFDQGVKLAKLVDPNLRGGAKVSVHVGGGSSATIEGGNPRQFLAAAVRELELQGFKRAEITPKMIEGMMSGMASPGETHRAIEGTVIHAETEGGNTDD